MLCRRLRLTEIGRKMRPIGVRVERMIAILFYEEMSCCLYLTAVYIIKELMLSL